MFPQADHNLLCFGCNGLSLFLLLDHSFLAIIFCLGIILWCSFFFFYRNFLLNFVPKIDGERSREGRMLVTSTSFSVIISSQSQGGTYTSFIRFETTKYWFASVFNSRIISVPCPRVFPRGSGYTSKVPSSAEELKTLCEGLGCLEDFGGMDATVTLSATRKLEAVVNILGLQTSHQSKVENDRHLL